MIKPEFILKSFQNCFNVTNKNYNASITGVKKKIWLYQNTNYCFFIVLNLKVNAQVRFILT